MSNIRCPMCDYPADECACEDRYGRSEPAGRPVRPHRSGGGLPPEEPEGPSHVPYYLRHSEDDLPVSGEEFLRRYPQLASTKTTDSEPAEGEGGDDVCVCGLTYSEHTPDDGHSFTPMREHYDTTEQHDAMLESGVPEWVKNRLIVAARQYRHNDDNSPDITNPRQGFVAAYDKQAIERLIAEIFVAPQPEQEDK